MLLILRSDIDLHIRPENNSSDFIIRIPNIGPNKQVCLKRLLLHVPDVTSSTPLLVTVEGLCEPILYGDEYIPFLRALHIDDTFEWYVNCLENPKALIHVHIRDVTNDFSIVIDPRYQPTKVRDTVAASSVLFLEFRDAPK